MDRNRLVANTLVFLDDLKAGVPQSSMVDTLNELNIPTVEIRREFIKDFDKELIDIKEKAESHNMTVFYSVPEWVYKAGKLRYDDLNQYFEEAHRMNCHNIKFNIGELEEVSTDDIEKLNGLCEKYEMKMTVENDQTAENGRSEKIYNFLTTVKEMNGKITFTFDTGNWLFQDEDPCKNAELLKSFVTYIHLKDVGEDRSNCLLNEGTVEWKKLLEILPHVPVAFEYPCRDKEQLQLEVDKIIEL